MEELLVCKICGRGGFRKLNSHLWNIHQMRASVYEIEYQSPVCLKSVNDKISASVKATIKALYPSSYYRDRNLKRSTLEFRRKASEKNVQVWARRSREEREALLSKVFWNSEYRERFRQFHASMSSEDRADWIHRSFRQGARHQTLPEREVEFYLNLHYPGEWLYNGSGRGVEETVIGGRIPDFINVNGKKAVIEVFGEYWHAPEELEPKVAHYARYGFSCIVLWEYECYDVCLLERRLG